MNSKRSQLFDRVRDALLNEWDPIGIQDFAEAADEYDSYAADLCELLGRNASVTEVFKYLWQLETEHMSLRGEKRRTEDFASRLLEIATTSFKTSEE